MLLKCSTVNTLFGNTLTVMCRDHHWTLVLQGKWVSAPSKAQPCLWTPPKLHKCNMRGTNPEVIEPLFISSVSRRWWVERQRGIETQKSVWERLTITTWKAWMWDFEGEGSCNIAQGQLTVKINVIKKRVPELTGYNCIAEWWQETQLSVPVWPWKLMMGERVGGTG